ncbi:MAG: GTP 3',8-cyclase MoaA [Gemmatimonadota bacterium]|nr:GTP 3',8-cyclase MoaA [Gemmatimonadota bacterium]
MPGRSVTSPPLLDRFERALDSLRVSVTDRCNLRCSYCMPEQDYVWLPRSSILDYEEAAHLVEVFSTLGVSRVRITGGEPLLRQNLPHLVGLLRSNPRLTDLAITTNGVLLERHAGALREAGLDRITISLDTLVPERFHRLSRRARLEDVLRGIEAACAAGFTKTKLNTVVVRGFNDDELTKLIDFSRDKGVEVRFIEYMDVGGATRWSSRDVVSRLEILDILERSHGRVSPVDAARETGVPADRYALPDGTVFGIIASTTQPFCGSCGRSRLTADGMWYLCLYADEGVDLKSLLRPGASDQDIADSIRSAWSERADRGAEARLTQIARGPLFAPTGLRHDPHREMHTRGG